MKKRIVTIRIDAYHFYMPDVIVGRFTKGTRYYINVTPSSLRKLQRAQLRLAGLEQEVAK